VKGSYDDFHDKIIVIQNLQPFLKDWGFTIPENKMMQCVDISVFKNSLEIPLEIERYQGDGFKNFQDLTIVPRKKEGRGIFIKLSHDRLDCYSAYFSSFREYGHESKRIDAKTNDKMTALNIDSIYVHHGWQRLAVLIEASEIQ